MTEILTVSGKRYDNMSSAFNNYPETWFQQDGATAHWDKVYINKPRTTEQIKENIRAEIRMLTQHCAAENGGHLSVIVFHK